MPGRQYTATNYRYGFNGKEEDNEVKGAGNSLNFGARIYDPRLGRFLSIDPLVRKYPFWAPYVFAGNCPIRYVDIEGKGPGDKFASPDLAALDWGSTYNSVSIHYNTEYVSAIYKVTAGTVVYYSYTTAASGGAEHAYDQDPPVGTVLVADIHSHAAYDPEYLSEKFSDGDKDVADAKRVNGYLTTPNGSLQRYDYRTKTISFLSTTLPNDPDDPYVFPILDTREKISLTSASQSQDVPQKIASPTTKQDTPQKTTTTPAKYEPAKAVDQDTPVPPPHNEPY